MTVTPLMIFKIAMVVISIGMIAKDSGPTNLNEQQIDTVLDQAGWSASLHTQAKEVALCESHWDAYATNGSALGLFQLRDVTTYADGRTWQGWWRYFGFDSSRYSDPVYNAKLALLVYQYDVDHDNGDGWYAWSCKPTSAASLPPG